MPTKKATKKTTKKTRTVTAKFSAKVPETIIKCCEGNATAKNKKRHSTSKGGSFYFLGMIGAAIYFISTATGFRIGVLGILKAFVRPIFLVHGLLKFLAL